MVEPSYHRRGRVHLLVVIGLLLLTSGEVIAQRIGNDSLVWSVRLYPRNPNYIEVLIDPRYMGDSYITGQIRYEVSFYAERNQPLGTKIFTFTKDMTSHRHVYRQYVPHPYSTAKKVKGGAAHYHVRAGGSAALMLDSSFRPCLEEFPKDPENLKDQEELVVNWRLLDKSAGEQLGVYPYLIRDARGELRPPGGYKWSNPDDPNDTGVVLMPGLVKDSEGQLRPTGSYRWVSASDPDDFRVVLARGLVKRADGNLYPAGGYRWFRPGWPNDYCVVPLPGLIEGRDGRLHPAPGYRWVMPNDPNDFRVERVP